MMSKKRVTGYVELSTIADFQNLRQKFPEAPVVKVMSSRHLQDMATRHHRIISELQSFYDNDPKLKEQMVQTYLEVGKEMDEIERLMKYANRESFFVLTTPEFLYLLKLSNKDAEFYGAEFPNVKKMEWVF